jgi:hypothetical protein
VADVRIHVSDMRDPLQKCVKSINIATCQGNCPRVAFVTFVIPTSASETYTYQAKYTMTIFNTTSRITELRQSVKFLPSFRDRLRPPGCSRWLGKFKTDKEEPYCVVPRPPFGSCAPWSWIRTESGEKCPPLPQLFTLENLIESKSFRIVETNLPQ